MLRFLFKNENGGELELRKPLSIVLNMDEDIPADSVSVCFSGEAEVDEYDYFEVYDGAEVIFSGIVDETSRVINSDKDYTRINARSMAAALLDNESKPVFYNYLSTDVVFFNHLKPYGIKSYVGENICLPGSFNVSKGSTNWQVLQSFCVNMFGRKPRIRPDGTADFTGLKNDREVVFSNTDGIRYNSIKENKKRYKKLSRVYVKCADNDYSTVLENPEYGESPIKRERYIDATNPLVTTELGDKMIKTSNRDSKIVTLSCPSRVLGILGAKAVVDCSGQKISGMYICSLRYSLSYSGENTVVTLKNI